jgi:tetratricopeptide (TPR) repeat protein
LPTSHAGGFPGERPTIRLRPDAGAPAAPAEPALPVLDPVGASRSLDVGTFYMKKGDYDAAIDRFQEAAQRQPKLAKPYLLMGEAYEKKNDPASAVTAYRKYLQLFPKAPDQDKVNKRVEKLTELQSKRDTSQH